MKVAVIIPTLYRSKNLSDVLELLVKQTVKSDEIIIIDQADIAEIEYSVYNKFKNLLPLNVYHLDIRSQTSARNWGLRLTSADLMISVDDDTIFEDSFIENHIKAIDKYKCDAISGASGHIGVELRNEYRKPEFWESPIITFTHSPLVNYSCQIASVAGCNFSVKVKAAKAIGGFDETIPFLGEDSDFGYRLQLNGYRIVHEPNVFLRHLKSPMGGGRFSKKPKNRFQKLFSPIVQPCFIYFIRKNFSSFSAFTYLFGLVIRGYPLHAKYKLKTFSRIPFNVIGAIISWKISTKLIKKGPHYIQNNPLGTINKVI